MDRISPTGRTRMPQRRTRPSVGQQTNNNRTIPADVVNELAARRRVIVPRRPITNTNQIQTARIQQRPPPRRAPPPVRILEDDDFDDDQQEVINLVTPPQNRHVQQERRAPRNVDDNEVRRELFRQVESDSSSDDDDQDPFDEPQFLHAAHVIDDDDDDDDSENDDINIILNDLHAEERAESEQERTDRELARRLQMEENMSFHRMHHALHHQAPQQAPQIPTHRHFGDLRNDELAQRLQHAELQEQAAAMARRRIMLEQVFARYGIPFDHQRPRLYIGQNAPQQNAIPRSLMSLHFVDRDFDERDYEMLLQLDEQVPNRKMADEKLVEKVPLITVKAGDKYDRCSVCLCDMEQGEVRRELPCSHGFHKECIDKWLKDYKETCPICKQSLSEMEPKLEQQNKKRKVESTSSSSRRHKKRKVSAETSE